MSGNFNGSSQWQPWYISSVVFTGGMYSACRSAGFELPVGVQSHYTGKLVEEVYVMESGDSGCRGVGS